MNLYNDILDDVKAEILDHLKRWKPNLAKSTGVVPSRQLPAAGNTGAGYTAAPGSPHYDVSGTAQQAMAQHEAKSNPHPQYATEHALEIEIAQRTSADAALGTRIDGETQTRQQADTQLGQQLGQHASQHASTTQLGHVRIDGVSITIDADGTIRGSFSGTVLETMVPADQYHEAGTLHQLLDRLFGRIAQQDARIAALESGTNNLEFHTAANSGHLVTTGVI